MVQPLQNLNCEKGESLQKSETKNTKLFRNITIFQPSIFVGGGFSCLVFRSGHNDAHVAIQACWKRIPTMMEAFQGAERHADDVELFVQSSL